MLNAFQLIVAALFVLLILIKPSVQLDTFNPNLMCSRIKNGTTVKDPRACNIWIQCIDGKPITGTCPGSEFYDRVTEKCVPFQSIQCISSNPCSSTAGSNGFVADPCSCNGYYYCLNGTASRGNCDPGYNFNSGTQDCIRNYPCAAKMNPESVCNIVPDGIFVKDTNNCNGYEMCWKGTVMNGSCPYTFYLDAFTGMCVYQDQVDCVQPTTTVSPNQPDPKDVCAKAGDFVSDNHSCNGYYYCQATSNGVIVLEHGLCPKGRFFDASADGGACVARTQVVCSYNRCTGLGSPSIELANESNDNCEGFAICQNGVKIGSGTCPTDEYFNEMTQNCTTKQISFPACVLSSTTAPAATTTTVATTTTRPPTTTTTVSPTTTTINPITTTVKTTTTTIKPITTTMKTTSTTKSTIK